MLDDPSGRSPIPQHTRSLICPRILAGGFERNGADKVVKKEEGSDSPYPNDRPRRDGNALDDGEGEGEEEEEDPMAAMMGFGGFGTTKVSCRAISTFFFKFDFRC